MSGERHDCEKVFIVGMTEPMLDEVSPLGEPRRYDIPVEKRIVP
jgi:hypothetical protein